MGILPYVATHMREIENEIDMAKAKVSEIQI